jgi:hypothetical protein
MQIFNNNTAEHASEMQIRIRWSENIQSQFTPAARAAGAAGEKIPCSDGGNSSS